MKDREMRTRAVTWSAAGNEETKGDDQAVLSLPLLSSLSPVTDEQYNHPQSKTCQRVFALLLGSSPVGRHGSQV